MTLSRLRTRVATFAAVLAVAVAPATMLAAPAAHAAPVSATAPAAGTAASIDGCVPDPVLCPQRMYVGAYVDGLPADPHALDAFTAETGKSPSVAMYYQSFGDPVDTAALTRLAGQGRLPMISWEPYDAAEPSTNPYPLADIAAGKFDGYLQSAGRALAAVGKPVAVRFGHEMNGNWYPWGQGVNGNTAAGYVAAYRHVHDVLRSAGAGNVRWVWSPNLIDFAPTQDLAALYPGDAYVDWVGVSGYFAQPTDTYANRFPPTLAQFDRVAPTKPIFITETAVLPGRTRPAMIHDLLAGLLGTPRLVGFIWFDEPKRADWRIGNDPAAAAALKADLSSPYFGVPGHMNDPVSAAPVAVGSAWITGTAQAGQTLASSTGKWRPAAGSGPMTVTRRWYRCTTPTDPGTCTATSATNGGYGLSTWDANKFMRIEVTATNAAGRTVAWSAATPAVLMTPATPAPPTVQANSGALRVLFPTVPFGATHWRLSIGGVAKPLIPVTAKDYWLTGLTNGHSYTLTLAAVDYAGAVSLSSAGTAGTAVPLTIPAAPYIKVVGSTAVLTLPKAPPAGASTWWLTVDGARRTLARTAAPVTFTGLRAGVRHTWALQAVAGSWGRTTLTAASGAVGGTFTAIGTPGSPRISRGRGQVTFTFPRVPAGASGWQLTVGAAGYPVVPVRTAAYTVRGLRAGRATGWTLRAVYATPSQSVQSAIIRGTVIP